MPDQAPRSLQPGAHPEDAIAASADDSHLQLALGDGLSVTEATSTQGVDIKPRNPDIHLAHHPVDTDRLGHRCKSPNASSQGKTDSVIQDFTFQSSPGVRAEAKPSSGPRPCLAPSPSLFCCSSFSLSSSKENTLSKSQCTQIPNHPELREPDDLYRMSLHLVLTITAKVALMISTLISRK